MAMITSAYNLLKLEVVILRRWPELLSYLLWYPAKVLYIVGALQGFLAEHFTPIRKPVCIENMNLLDFPLFLFAAKMY